MWTQDNGSVANVEAAIRDMQFIELAAIDSDTEVGGMDRNIKSIEASSVDSGLDLDEPDWGDKEHIAFSAVNDKADGVKDRLIRGLENVKDLGRIYWSGYEDVVNETHSVDKGTSGSMI